MQAVGWCAKPIPSTSGSAGGTARRARRNSRPLVDRLERAREIALETVRLTAGFDFPDYEQDYELVALDQPGEYPIDRGRIVSNRGLDIAVVRVRRALRGRARRAGRTRSTRASSSAARTCAGRSRATPSRPNPGSPRSPRRSPPRLVSIRPGATRSAASSSAPCSSCTQPTRRWRLIAEYEEPDAPAVEFEPTAWTAYGCTEAPRGILYHRYRDRRRRDDPGRQDRAADVAEPADDRGGPARGGRALARHAGRGAFASAASRRSATTIRASRARPTS